MTDQPETVFVAAAAYDTVAAALADYEAVKELYREIGTSDEFDAAVIQRDADGKVEIISKHEQPTRAGAKHGLKWGLAVGAATALFPAVGILGALTVGGGVGAAAGAAAGHASGGMRREDLKELGDILEQGQAGLIVVYAATVADQIASRVKAERLISHETEITAV